MISLGLLNVLVSPTERSSPKIGGNPIENVGGRARGISIEFPSQIYRLATIYFSTDRRNSPPRQARRPGSF